MKTAELLSRVYLQQPRLASLKMRMNFTVTATLPNAKPGDVRQVDLLKLQPHPNSESDQLLPIQGTRKETTVDSSLRATVTYTKAEAEMTEVGDWVEVIFNGVTESAQIRVTLQAGSGSLN